MERRVFFTPPKRVISPTWGPSLPCKQALTTTNSFRLLLYCANWGFCILNLTRVTKFEYERTGEISLRRHRANDLLLLMSSLGEKPETSLVK